MPTKSDFYEMQSNCIKTLEGFGPVLAASSEQIEYYKTKGRLELLNEILR